MRQFKLFNKSRTESFDLNSGGVLAIDNSSGLGNRRNNTILNSRTRNYLINTSNDFQPIALKIVFGVEGKNAYALYNGLMNFIRHHGTEGLVLGYKALTEMIYTDVVLSEATKTNKTNFGVLEETFTFDRLTPFYRYRKEEGKSILIKNDYYENILPKITLANRAWASPEITIGGVNKLDMDDTVITVDDLTIRYEKSTNTFIFNGTGAGEIYPINLPELTDKFVSMTRINLTENKHNSSLTFLCYDFSLSRTVRALENDAVGEESSVMYQHQGELRYGFYFNGTFEDYRVKIQIAEAIPTKNEIIPNLKGKEDLGDGWYKLGQKGEVQLIFNTISAEYRYTSGTVTGGNLDFDLLLEPGITYTLSYIYVSGTKNGRIGINNGNKGIIRLQGNSNFSSTFVSDGYVRLWCESGTSVEDWTFKLQIEKGTEATPFINPYVPIAYSDPSDLTQTIAINSPLQISDEFIIDAEFKEVKRNSNQAYNEIDKTKNTFPIIPRGAHNISSEQPIRVEWKEWVID